MEWMLDSLEALTGSPWAYALILAVAAIDVLFPVVPSEATVITAGVFAAVGELSLAAVIAAGAAGALPGRPAAAAGGRGLRRGLLPGARRGPPRRPPHGP